jgi:hypothetical protein
MDALPPTNRTLDEIDAAARDMGIVPGDPAYAFYTGLRRLYAEQQAELAQAVAGYWFHGNQQLVAGVSAGAQECHDQQGGTICFIPVSRHQNSATQERPYLTNAGSPTRS